MRTNRISAYLIGMILAFMTISALATDRPFPAKTKHGTMTPAAFPNVIMDGRLRNLSPAAQIRTAENLIETPGSLRGANYIVNYTENAQGDIERIWILTPEEASKLPPAPITGPMPSRHD